MKLPASWLYWYLPWIYCNVLLAILALAPSLLQNAKPPRAVNCSLPYDEVASPYEGRADDAYCTRVTFQGLASDGPPPPGVSRLQHYVAQRSEFSMTGRGWQTAGRVYAAVTFDSGGRIQKIRLVKGFSEAINAEFLRLLWETNDLPGSWVVDRYGTCWPENTALVWVRYDARWQ